MEFGVQLLEAILQAILQLVIQPFYYVGIIMIILQYRKQIMFERKLFSTRLHSLYDETWRTIVWGAVCGIVVSLLMAVVGVSISLNVVLLLWAISIVLIFFRVRYLCFAYSVGILGILKVIFMIPALAEDVSLQWISRTLASAHISGLLALVALLHLAEAFLISKQGARSAIPLFVEGKRGKIIGGYHLQGFWSIPLFLLIPLQSTGGSSLPWQPLLGGDLWSGGGWAILGFPMVIGFAEMTTSFLPKVKAKSSSKLLACYALIVLVLAICVEYLSVLTIGACLLTILLHEALVWYSNWQESHRSPLYIHDKRGLTILAILPNSPAADMGLETGEIIHKVNGLKVQTKEQLHQAIQTNSAFCKLEVLNLEGQSKFVHKALFAGEHHQLGVVLAPDQDAMYWIANTEKSILFYLKQKLSGVKQKASPFS